MTRIDSTSSNTTWPNRHTVQKGETFSSIAALHHLSTSALQGANPDIPDRSLQIGQKISIPVLQNSKAIPSKINDHSFMQGFALTQQIESGRDSFGAYQNIDKGIVSYGCIQFTLQSGNLQRVIEKYVSTSLSPAAIKLKHFIPWTDKLENLRHNRSFAQALRSAANDPAMKNAQLQVAKEGFWDPAASKASNLGLSSNLAKSIFFDTNVQGGLNKICARTQNRLAGQTLNEQQFLDVFLQERTKYLEKVAPQTVGRLNIFSQALKLNDLSLQRSIH